MTGLPGAFFSGVLALCLWHAAPASAQEATTGHALGAGAGVVAGESRDALASPLHYRATFLAVQADYAYRGRRSRPRLSLFYGRSRPTSAITQGDLHAQEAWQVRVRGQYTRRAASRRQGRLALYAGAGLEACASVREHRYREHATETTGFVYAALSLSAVGAYRLRKRDELHAQVDLPVAAYVRRPPYGLRGYYEDHLALPGGFARFGAVLAYEAQLAPGLAVRVSYESLYYRMEHPLPAAGVEHAGLLSLVWVR